MKSTGTNKSGVSPVTDEPGGDENVLQILLVVFWDTEHVQWVALVLVPQLYRQKHHIVHMSLTTGQCMTLYARVTT